MAAARVALLALACVAGVLSGPTGAKVSPGPAPAQAAPAQAAPRVSRHAGDWFYKQLTVPAGSGGAPGVRIAAPIALVVPLTTSDGDQRDNVRVSSVEPKRWRAPRPAAPAPAARAADPDIPSLITQVPSSELVAMFQAETSQDADLPPVVLPPQPGAPPPPPPPPPPPSVCVLSPAADAPHTKRALRQTSAGSPSTPRFSVSLALRGRLTLPRPGYTEAFNASWHAPFGAMRVDFHDGATSVLRRVDGGKLTRVERRLSRVGAAPRTLCAQLTQDAAAAAPADRAPPALPDLQPFAFAEYVQLEGRRAELWRHSVAGAPGELGGARGEALTFRHEMLLTRGPDDFITPIRYSVEVNSSVLGANSSGHVFHYDEVVAQEPAPEQLRVEALGCGQLEPTSELARVDPLREFTLATFDPRHEDIYISYVKSNKRQYNDETEEAVRKNLIRQSTLFSEAGNRVGASFLMGHTELSDRLQGELERMAGVDERARSRLPAEVFPYSRGQTRALHDALPAAFDWREKGGVTPARHQGVCSSCWAFAVTGAVEGALFRETRRLVPLSEQAVVDCASTYGGGGCQPSWPSSAYDYVSERGLPARDLYRAYQAQVQQCEDKQAQPVTYISAHVNVTRNSLSALKVAIHKHAPSVVIIDMGQPSFKNYIGDVYNDDRCNRRGVQKIKHAMLAVGWGAAAAGEYLVLKNSHGESWGEKGFMRIAGHNTCGVLERPTYPRLQSDDVPQPKLPQGTN